MAEKKHSNVLDLGTSIFPSSAAAATLDLNINQISPGTGSFNIAQGTSQSQRIGNRIRITNCRLKGTIVPNPYNATTNPGPQPCVVQMFIFYDKTATTSYPIPFTNNDFFQFGSTATGFSNDLVDTWAPINTDRYRVVYRRQWKVGFATNAGTGANAGQQQFANNDFKLNCHFNVNVTKWLVKNVVYRDNNIDPSTRGLWFTFVACAADGSNYGSAIIPAHYQYTQDLDYTDL